MISVAMAVFNGDRYINEQLDSILRQTKLPDEVVITDDSDNDNTYRIINNYISEYKSVKWVYLKNEERLGYCYNFFKAISLTSGDIVFLSDQDDIWELDKIEKMSDCMLKDNDIKCLCSKYRYIDKDGNAIGKAHEYSTNISYILNSKTKMYFKLDMKEYFKILAFPGMCFAITRELVDELNLLLNKVNREEIVYHDLVISFLAAKDNRFYIYNDVLCNYRMHGDNAIGVDEYNNKDKQDRVEWLENLIKSQRNILSYTSSLSETNKELDYKNYANGVISFNIERVHCLKDKKLFSLMLKVFNLNKYLSSRSYLGDLIYIINNG